MKILITAPYNETGRKELERHFGEVIYKPWKDHGRGYNEEELIGLLFCVFESAKNSWLMVLYRIVCLMGFSNITSKPSKDAIFRDENRIALMSGAYCFMVFMMDGLSKFII